MEKENCLNEVTYPLQKRAEIVQWFLVSALIFIVPMLVPQLLSLIFGETSVIASNSQYVVGTIVNTALIIAAINVKGWKQIVGIITFPSISAMCSGLIFKTASVYSVYMIPFIWIGNLVFVYIYKKLLGQKKINYILTAILAILLKAAIIYLGFKIFTMVSIIPSVGKIFTMLNMSMGLNQIITASVASVICFGIYKIYVNKRSNK